MTRFLLVALILLPLTACEAVAIASDVTNLLSTLGDGTFHP